MAFHTHQEGGPVCIHATKKACDNAYADWQAMQQVLLAYRVAVSGDTKRFKHDQSQLGQLVRVIAGEHPDIMNGDGNPSQDTWAKRLRAAIERVKAGDLPEYNLYRLASVASE